MVLGAHFRFTSSRLVIFIAAAVLLVSGIPSICGAQAASFFGPTAYLQFSDSPFSGLGLANFQLETFEDNLLNTPGVSANFGAPFGPASNADSVDADDGSIDGSGTAGHSFFFINGSAGVTFSFSGSLPTHAGIVWTDGGGDTLFEAFGPGLVSLGTIGPVSIADFSNSGTTAEDRFFGVSDPGGILALKISNTAGGIEVDHLQYGNAVAVIPLPGAVWLLGSGLVGLIGFGRRFKRT